MPCNCRRCDCADRKACYLVESRLKALACIFDHVADDMIGKDSSVFVSLTAIEGQYCGQVGSNSAGSFVNAFVMGDTFDGGPASAISILGDLSGLVPLNFLPKADEKLEADSDWLLTTLCMPTTVGNTPCLKCVAINGSAKTICDVTSISADLANYAAIAQNLRYAAALYGCQNS